MTTATRQDSPRATISRWAAFRDLEDVYERVGHPENVNAMLSDGTLTVRVGKSNAGRPRRIEIKDS